jgi:hypothetical protein
MSAIISIIEFLFVICIVGLVFYFVYRYYKRIDVIYINLSDNHSLKLLKHVICEYLVCVDVKKRNTGTIFTIKVFEVSGFNLNLKSHQFIRLNDFLFIDNVEKTELVLKNTIDIINSFYGSSNVIYSRDGIVK